MTCIMATETDIIVSADGVVLYSTSGNIVSVQPCSI